jgi:hypothetical protein
MMNSRASYHHEAKHRATSSILRKLLDKVSAIAIPVDETCANYCERIGGEIKFLSETLICLRFLGRDSEERSAMLRLIKGLLLHRHTMLSYALNPSLSSWYLNTVVMLQDFFDLRAEKKFVLSLVEFYGTLDEDAPIYRNEERKFLMALLQGEKYTPERTSIPKRFYYYTRDQIYAATHLLFYLNGYGSDLYVADEATEVALEHLLIRSYRERNLDLMLELLLSYQSIAGIDPVKCTMFHHLLCKLIDRAPGFLSLLVEEDGSHFDEFYHQALLYLLLVSSRCFPEDHEGFDVDAYRETVASYRFYSSLRSHNYVNAARQYSRLPAGPNMRSAFHKAHFDAYLESQKLLVQP